jgi:hypothetical protein
MDRMIALRVWLLSSMLMLGIWLPAAAASPPLSLSPSAQDRRLIDAQILNQESQAKYYRSLTGQGLVLAVPGLLGVFGVIIGAAMSFLALSRQAKNQERLDFNRWKREADQLAIERQKARADQRRLDIRLAAADLAKQMAKAAHSMTSLTWIARNDPGHFARGLVEKYDRRLDSLYSEMAAALVVLAALSPEFFRHMQPLAESVYKLDGEIARQCILPSLPSLGDLWLEARQFEHDLPDTVLGLFLAEAPATEPPAA